MSAGPHAVTTDPANAPLGGEEMGVSSRALTAASAGVSPGCVICGTALAGPLGALFRLAGIKRSSRNPNLCNRCNTHVEEGRVVELTVLFADLSGFTELTHRLGPERTHAVVDAFLKTATYVLVRHGAFIDKYVGDAVMAFFNAPIRSEDHAARAVAAALEIQAELPALGERFGIELRAAIGIASGWAHVGRLGSSDGKDFTAIGDVVNLAARLEGEAWAGQVVVDGPVYRQVADQVPAATAECLALKGFPAPVPAYRLGPPAAGDRRPPWPVDAPPSARPGMSLGAILFAVLGAPCAAVTLVGPLAVLLGLGSLFGVLGTTVLAALDTDPLRLVLLSIATLGVAANLYTLWHARRLRQQAAAGNRFVGLTALERRRSALVLTAALLTLGLVGYELIAHAVLH